MKHSILLAIVVLFLMSGCGSTEESPQQAVNQQQQTEQTTEKQGVVWKIHEEMTSEMGDETRDGTITFYDDKTIRVQDGVVDISYTLEYSEEGTKVQLTNLEMAEDVLNFKISTKDETKQVWEALENDVQSVWTMTKQ